VSQPFIGEIRMFGGNFAPAGWAFCDGALQPISQNDALFALIGTTYGGDGQTTFALPNLQSRIPLHSGQGPGLSNYTLAQTGGAETVTLTVQQVPAHSHAPAAATAATGSDPAGSVPAGGSVKQFSSQPPDQPMNAAQAGVAGGSQPHANMPPFLALNFIISLFGVFPSQT
jgi:microcystin-dependent protein